MNDSEDKKPSEVVAEVNRVVIRPETEGWYWHRASDQHIWRCVEVYRESGQWYWSPERSVVGNSYSVENNIGEHWIPIPTPEVD